MTLSAGPDYIYFYVFKSTGFGLNFQSFKININSFEIVDQHLELSITEALASNSEYTVKLKALASKRVRV